MEEVVTEEELTVVQIESKVKEKTKSAPNPSLRKKRAKKHNNF